MDAKRNSPRSLAFIVGTLDSGGIERLVMEWCLYLKQHTSWTPVVICVLERRGVFWSPLEQRGIQVLECRLKNDGMRPFIFRMAKLLRTQRVEVVHSQVAFSLLWQTIGFVLGGGKKIIFTQHNEYQNWSSSIAKLRLRFYYFLSRPFIAHYTCVSNHVRESLSVLLGSENKFQVVHNSVNTEVFRQRTEWREEARIRMGVTKDEYCFGMVANYSKQKGHVFALEACSRLKKEIELPFKMVLIGNGDFTPAIDQARSLEIVENVLFLGKRTDVDVLLQGMDAFVLPSLWEGMPLSLLEAMSSGVPVIATNVSGTQEVLTVKTGTLVEASSPLTLCNAMKDYLLHPETAKELAQRALEDVKARFSLSSIIQQYLLLYEN